MKKKGEIISIFGGPTPQPGEVRKEVVAELEKALERARSGQTIGICLVETLNPTMDSTIWVVSGYTTRSTIGSLMEIVVNECKK